MLSLRRKSKLLNLVLLLIIVNATFLIAFFYLKPKAVENQPGGQIEQIRRQIDSDIERLGPDQALQNIEDKYASKSREIGHVAGHIYGEELFRKFGPKGAVHCNEKLDFGCYHGFFSTYISLSGLDHLSEIDEVCKSAPNYLECQHGIGHGIYDYVGGAKNMDKALKICSTLSWKGKLYGCQDGIWMEFNSPSVGTDLKNYRKNREFDPNNPYYPCLTVPTEYQRSCFNKLPNYWTDINKKDKYGNVNTLCLGVKDPINRKSCFMGFGPLLLSESSYTSDDVINVCNRLDKDYRMVCRSTTSWFFWGDKNKKMAEEICTKGFTSEESSQCLNYPLVYGDVLELRNSYMP